jgi:RNA polymerase sigma-70 factor (ECF subfamily)
MTRDPDRHLIRRLQRGDRDAVEALYRQHVRRVWQYAYARTHDREAAADITQDTFVRVVRSVSTFEKRSKVSTWLFAVTRSATVDYLRRQRSVDSDEPRLLRIPANVEPDPVEQQEAREHIRAAIRRLRPAMRDVIVLCELCELTTRDTASALNWSETRVRVTLHRARKRLADLLCESEFETGTTDTRDTNRKTKR